MPQKYYQDVHVRARIREFMGAGPAVPTAMFITADSSEAHVQYHPKAVDTLDECLRRGLEIGRSIWDRDSLLIH